jgi:hypothetical protein
MEPPTTGVPSDFTFDTQPPLGPPTPTGAPPETQSQAAFRAQVSLSSLSHGPVTGHFVMTQPHPCRVGWQLGPAVLPSAQISTGAPGAGPHAFGWHAVSVGVDVDIGAPAGPVPLAPPPLAGSGAGTGVAPCGPSTLTDPPTTGLPSD